MAYPLKIVVKETTEALKVQIKNCSSQQQKRVQMLLLIKKGKHPTKDSLATALGVSEQSIQTWRTKYKQGGMEVLLTELRGGKKKAQIDDRAYGIIEKRLSNPKEGFKGYKDAQDWINKEFGLKMKYHAVNKFIKRKYGAKLKVGRKSHVLKDPTAEAVFKKPSQRIKTH